MRNQNPKKAFSETLMEELGHGENFSQTLEHFKTFRNDLLSPKEYTELLKNLQAALLILQDESLKNIRTLETSIMEMTQDLN